QGFLRIDTIQGQEPWVGQTFRTSETRVFAEAQILRWLYFNTRTGWGHQIFSDPVAPYLGDQRTFYGELRLQPTPRLAESITYDRVGFNRHDTGEHVFTVNVVNSKTTFQVDRRLPFPAPVQYTSSESRVLTDFLASWELVPGTVAYAGYGSLIERQEWDGPLATPNIGQYRTTQRSL